MEKVKIYKFGAINDGSAAMKDILGGKGANLAEMASLGFPVPPGFTIPTSVSIEYLNHQANYNGHMVLQEVSQSVIEGMNYLKDQFGFTPLVSVRSGARVSMPGMMDTILNVGIDDSNLDSWKSRLGERTALDSYRRFLQMYGATALGIPMEHFEAQLSDIRANAKVDSDADIPASYLTRLVKRYHVVYAAAGQAVPDQQAALIGAVQAVFSSWMTPRAIAYRKDNDIPESWGTAVTVQAMVFGNGDVQSCSGVAFTRDRNSGAKVPMGDWLVNAQGEDVVAGIRPTEPLDKLNQWNPVVYSQLNDLMQKLELHFRDMQDVEFTVAYGKLWMLQTRSAKRAAAAAFQVAFDMVKEGLITREDAMARVGPDQLLTMFKAVIDPKFKGKPIATGFPAGGRVVSGIACFSSKSAIAQKKKGADVILVRKETDPDDYEGIMASLGVLTATGGATSHAAVVARGKDKSCVVGCTSLVITEKSAAVDGATFKQGDKISIDGDTGNIYLGVVPVIEPKLTSAVQLVAQWFADAGNAYRVTGSTLKEVGQSLLTGIGDMAYVDTCTLLNNSDVELLSSYIEKCSFKRVVLDLSGVDAHYSATDKVFNKMFGATPYNADAGIKASHLCSVGFSQAAALKTIVKLPKGCNWEVALRNIGFTVLGAINSVADLLQSGDVSTIDDATITEVFGTKEALLWVQEAMVKAGKVAAKPLPKPEYWYEPLLRKGN